MVNHSLQELNMANNDIGDSGISAIAEALGNCKINKLNVSKCNITLCGATMLATTGLSSNHPTGIISISKVMMVNHSLQELRMGDNDIGDSGISAIAEALGNCKINSLTVVRCNITLHGAKMLAAALSSNHTIRKLSLIGNPITLEGALLIVKAAVDNTVCQRVWIDDEYKNDEVKKMMNVLQERGRQHVRMMNLMNQNENDYSGGQEETRGSRLCCVMLLMIVVMVIIGSRDDIKE